MASDLTNKTFPSDDIDDTKKNKDSNQNASQNLTNDERSKGGRTSSSQQDMSKLGQTGGDTDQQSDNSHDLTNKEKSERGSH